MKSKFVHENKKEAVMLSGVNLNATAKGASVGATVGSIVPGVGTLIGGGAGAVIGTVSSLFGKKKTYSDCGSAQRHAEQVFKQYLTTADVQKLMQDAEQNVGEVTGYGYTALGFHYMGGDDCQTTSSVGKAWKGRVDQLLAQRQQEAQQNTQQSNGNTTNAVATNQAGMPSWVLPAGIGIGTLGIIAAIAA